MRLIKESFSRAKEILTNPKDFFKGLTKEEGVKPAFKYLVVLSLFKDILGLVLSLVIGAVSRVQNAPQALVSSFPVVIIGYLFGLLFTFVIAAILFVWIKIWRGKGSYVKTYQIYVYSDTPNFLLGWIPLVNFFASLYGLWLLIVGTREVHSIGRTKSILMYVLIPVVVFVLIVAAAVFFGSQLSSIIGGLPLNTK